jgi:hypothetical protein
MWYTFIYKDRSFVYHEKMQDQSNGVTKSRKGNSFSFQSPIPGVHIYDNVWPDSDKFFEKLESDSFWEQDNPGNIKWIREDYLDDEVGKKSRTCWVYYDQELTNAFEEVIDSYLYHWNLDPHSRESFRITIYDGNGKEFFGTHSDDSFATPRTVSMVYYPTDDYEGGELEFIHFGIKIKPKAGQLFLFPSAYNLEHRVTPVTSGIRKTIVAFFNNLTYEERSFRETLLDKDKYYQPDIKYILRP